MWEGFVVANVHGAERRTQDAEEKAQIGGGGGGRGAAEPIGPPLGFGVGGVRALAQRGEGLGGGAEAARSGHVYVGRAEAAGAPAAAEEARSGGGGAAGAGAGRGEAADDFVLESGEEALLSVHGGSNAEGDGIGSCCLCCC